jgi:hypothetical protein
MSNTNVLRPIGPTTYVAVTTSSSTAVTISASGNNQMDYCAFLNTGTTPIAITIVPVVAGSGSAGVTAFPADGASAKVVVLGVSMQMPMVIAVPPVFSVTALGTASVGLYITPVGDQS